MNQIKNFFSRNLFGDKDLKVPRIILVVGLLSVVLIASYANYSLNEKDRYRFRVLSKAVIDSIFDSLEKHLIILRGVAGIYHEGNKMTFADLDNYVESVELNKYFPGSLGIGYLPKVRAEAPNDYSFPVVYISPSNDLNKSILGYDMFSEEKRRLTLIRAAETGLPSLTNQVSIKNISGYEQLSGFNIYFPIYAEVGAHNPEVDDTSLSSVAAFAYTAITSKEFFNNIFSKGFEKFVDVRINDLSTNPSMPLFSNGESVEQCPECEVINEEIDVLGNRWSLTFTSLPAFYSGSNKLIVFILCIGQLILVFVISALSYTQNKAKLKAESANKDKEELLIRERVARNQAEQASRLKEEFLATVSHELRNPLNAILGWAQIINRPNTSEENIKKGIQTIEKNVHVQAKLIDDLLEMSRIRAGKLILDIKTIDLAKVLESALETVDSAIKAKNIKIVKDIEAGLPKIKADDTRLQQVIWNLLSNSIKFSPEGSVIEIRIKRKDGAIVCSIKDHGAGISPDFLPNIFDRFRQENSKITRKHGGLGLGLAITKSLIELHGGEIDVKSQGLEKGAEFIFTIPIRADADVHETKRVDLTVEEIFEKKELEKMSILVIDDEPDTLEMLAILINEKGANVECATSVDEALGKIAEKDYDLVISDIGMPEKDGYELARSIRNHANENIRLKPLIALSAYARENDRSLSREAGFSAHLAKPLNASELFKVIQNLV